MDRWGKCFELAVAAGGVVTLQMALACGIPEQTLRDRAAREGWVWITRGAWLLPGVPDTPDVRARAHLELLGERAAVCRWTAGYVHGLTSTAPSKVQSLVPADRRPVGRSGAEVRRTRTLVESDVVDVDGLRTTSVARTLRDLAAEVESRRLYDLMTDAEQRRLATRTTSRPWPDDSTTDPGRAASGGSSRSVVGTAPIPASSGTRATMPATPGSIRPTGPSPSCCRVVSACTSTSRSRRSGSPSSATAMASTRTAPPSSVTASGGG